MIKSRTSMEDGSQSPPTKREKAAPASLRFTVLAWCVHAVALLRHADQHRVRHRIAQRLAAAGVPHELCVYVGAQHAFLREDRPETYDAGAAEDAFGRIVGALEGVRRGGS
ncbi:dienelactone hydrolase family protein [Streptomyces sp. NPDC004100]